MLLWFISTSLAAPVDSTAALLPYCEFAYDAFAPHGFEFATLPGKATSTSPAPLLEITTKGAQFRGEALTPPYVSLKETAATLTHLGDLHGSGWGGELNVVVEPTVTADKLGPLVAAIHEAGFREIRWLGLASKPATLPALADPALGAKLIKSLENPGKLSDPIEPPMVHCAALEDGFRVVADATAQLKCPLVVKVFQEQLSRCAEADHASLVTQAQVMFQTPTAGKLTSRVMVLDPSKPVVATGNAQFGDFVGAIEGRGWIR